MKRLITLLAALTIGSGLMAQSHSQVNRTNGANTVNDPYLKAYKYLALPVVSTPSLNGGLDSAGPIIYNISDSSLYYHTYYNWIRLAAGIISTPTWQQTLVQGSTLTQDNSIAGGNYDWTYTNWHNYILARNAFYKGDTSMRSTFFMSQGQNYLRNGYITSDTSYVKYNGIQTDTGQVQMINYYKAGGHSYWNNQVIADSLGVHLYSLSDSISATLDSVGSPINTLWVDRNNYMHRGPPPGAGAVQSVTGNIVSNTDPANPVVTQVQSDWNQSSSGAVDYIKNKPVLTDGTVISVDATGGTGVNVTGGPITSSGTFIITNTAPDQTVVLSNGTGISTTGTYPSFTITNTLPDQTVVLNSGTGISVTGTYPSFTITNTSPSLGGTVYRFDFTNANGMTGSVATATTTPNLTLGTSVNGIVQGDGTGFSAITVGPGLLFANSILSTNPVLTDGFIVRPQVVWLHDYVYNMTAGSYIINQTPYSNPSTDFTLTAADPTLDRIDVPVVNTSSAVDVVVGTPSSPAAEPSIDQSTQLEVSFITVTANTTSPVITQEWIYQENVEWLTAVAPSGTINFASTLNPYAGTKTIEGTAVANGTVMTFTPTGSFNVGTYSGGNMIYEIRSKANWSTTKHWTIRWYNGTTAIGNPVSFGSSSYGFVSTATSQYQTIVIPLSDFGNIAAATRFKITQTNSSGTIGWYLDNVQLQSPLGGGTPQTISLITDVTGTGQNTIATTVVGIRNKLVPSLSAGFLKYTGSAWTFDANTYLTANQAITVTATGDATGVSSSSATAPSLPLTLATVNSNVGTFGDATHTVQVTADGKGRITAIGNVAITATLSSFTATDGNGFDFTVTNSTTTPTLTATTTVTDTRVMYSNATAITGAAGMTFDGTSALTLGVTNTTLGKLLLKGNTSGTVTINSAAAAGTWTFTLPTTGGTNNYVLTTNGSGVSAWTDVTTIATATVTSVAATAASGMTVTGSPITTSGTLAFAWTGAVQGDLPYFSAANTISFLNKSTTAGFVLTNGGSSNNPAWGAPFTLTTTGTSGAATYSAGTLNIPNYAVSSVRLDQITAANTTNTINSVANLQEWQWNSIVGTDGFKISSSATTANFNLQTLLVDSLYGTNATASQTTTAMAIYNRHTGTTSTNISLSLTASGGTNNVALATNSVGRVGIGTAAPSEMLHVVGGIIASNIGVGGASPGSTFPVNISIGSSGGTSTSGTASSNSTIYVGYSYTGGSSQTTTSSAAGLIGFKFAPAGSSTSNLVTGVMGGLDVAPAPAANNPITAIPLGFAVRNKVSHTGGSGTQIKFTEYDAFYDVGLNTAGLLDTLIATGGTYNGLKLDSFWTVGSFTAHHIFERQNGAKAFSNILNSHSSIGTTTEPTSLLLLGAGSATANTAPLGFTSGPLETTARAGTEEYNNSFYATKNSTLRYGEGGTIADFTSDVNNSGTAETDIYTYTTPASTLAATGEKVMADFAGTFNDITATGQLQVYFGGTLIGNTGALTISATGAWVVKVMVIRTGSTTARASVNVSTPGGSTALYTAETDITGLTFTNTNIIKITGTAGGAGGGSSDITGKLGSIAWFPAAAN